jgi:hypothetical protein
MLCTSWRCVVSDGGECTVVVVTAGWVVVVALGVLAVVDAPPWGDDETDEGRVRSADFEPLPAARLATATTPTTRTQAAATIAIRALGPLAVPGVATIATTLPSGSRSARRAPIAAAVTAPVAGEPSEAKRDGRVGRSTHRVGVQCRRVRSGAVLRI